MRRSQSIITVQQHILQEQSKFRGASGEFSWLLSAITFAAKLIQVQVRHAGSRSAAGYRDSINVQGEIQHNLDVFANDVLIQGLSLRESIGVIASEENEKPIVTPNLSANAKYAVIFDPLDGSSNIDFAVGVGTIFAILRAPETDDAVPRPEEWLLQSGTKLVAAGYVLYGSSTILVYSSGDGVHGFTLDPSIGAFILTHENIVMPTHGRYYSVNESYREAFPASIQEYLNRVRSGVLGREYSSRYIGSLVADFHRTLLSGGVFLYPSTKKHPLGKLRLLYEANPVAFIAEQAGGLASDGQRRILEIEPQDIHERTPLIVGGTEEMGLFDECMRSD